VSPRNFHRGITIGDIAAGMATIQLSAAWITGPNVRIAIE
jgi:hypothetical protein